MAGDTEEKALPPSKRKLDRVRRKGQVPRSRDLVGAASLTGAAGSLLLGGGGILAAAVAMLEAAGDAAAGPFGPGLGTVLAKVGDAVARAVVPAYGAALGMAVLAAVAVLRGIPFSTDPITPKAENVSPVAGFKRLFRLRSLVELAKSLLKVALLGAVLVAVLGAGMRALLLAPGCGLACAQAAFGRIAAMLLPAAVAVFLAAGLLDVGLQRWLFLREQRMSVSESKRERKDMEGDPHIRGERRKLVREAAQEPGRLGVAAATLLAYDGKGAVGIRYRRGETPVPVVVCRSRDQRARALLSEAQRLGVPLVEDAELAQALARVAPGRPVPQAAFGKVAQALARAGAA